MAQRVSAYNEPGTLREYETVMILRPDLSDEEIASVNERIAGIIDKHSGKLLKVEAWGRRRLAYEIAKQAKGFYYYWRYLANNPLLDDLNHTLRMSEQVLRHLVVKLDENVHPDARPADVDPESLDPRLRRGRQAESAASESTAASESAAQPEEQQTGAVEAGPQDDGEPVEAKPAPGDSAEGTEAAGAEAAPETENQTQDEKETEE